MKVLIVGFGNPLAGDDGAGWRAAETLAARLRSPDVRVRAVRQLTPELAEEAAHAALVVFLDASVELRPGVLDCRRIEPASGDCVFWHQFGPEALLGVAERLYGRRPEALLFSVGAKTFTGPGLSSEVEQALPSLVRQVEELIERVAEAGKPARECDTPEADDDVFSVMH
ncbi:MAG: hydrogenase maturation protease [Bryobacterales bacterium]|nr:hydrogenase maturation protease [Bryobacteraceae bacterium]MDW8130546.1 hydrogenase maturation protease [Bryobacterales bacterium]